MKNKDKNLLLSFAVNAVIWCTLITVVSTSVSEHFKIKKYYEVNYYSNTNKYINISKCFGDSQPILLIRKFLFPSHRWTVNNSLFVVLIFYVFMFYVFLWKLLQSAYCMLFILRTVLKYAIRLQRLILIKDINRIKQVQIF